jgi:hypothetical protein
MIELGIQSINKACEHRVAANNHNIGKKTLKYKKKIIF